jgi:hypothetical protein
MDPSHKPPGAAPASPAGGDPSPTVPQLSLSSQPIGHALLAILFAGGTQRIGRSRSVALQPLLVRWPILGVGGALLRLYGQLR